MVRFHLRQRTRDQLFVAGTLPIFSRKWGEGKKFSEIVSEHPITTGPYVIGNVDMPRRIEFVRNPNYWADAIPGLGVRRGHFNFDRIVYRNYSENAVAREAFKAGEFDLFKEYGARSWLRLHQGAKWDDGRIVKRGFVTGFGQMMQADMMNMRRPLFQDIRVREALIYAYDFETVYKTGTYHRADSLFNNSDFAAQGAPGPGELKLLEPFRKSLPDARLRTGLPGSAHEGRAQRSAPQPAEGARAARGSRLETRRGGPAAQRQGGTLRVRVHVAARNPGSDLRRACCGNSGSR